MRLPLAGWWYNTTFHISIHTTTYEADYGTAKELLSIAIFFAGFDGGICRPKPAS